MLLDAWAIPVCLFFSWVYMRPKYRWTQVLGIVICVGGLGLLVASDEITDKDWPALSRAKGDVFMLVGASLYGFSTYSSYRVDLNAHDLLQLTRRKSSSSAGPRSTK